MHFAYADETLTQLETAVANSVTIVVASVMEDKLPSYQAAQQEEQERPAGLSAYSDYTILISHHSFSEVLVE